MQRHLATEEPTTEGYGIVCDGKVYLTTLAPTRRDCLALWMANVLGVPTLKIEENFLEAVWKQYTPVASMVNMRVAKISILIDPVHIKNPQ